jgi:hypothetical protein
MRDWCTLSEAAGDLSVLDCQYFINGRGQRLCDEFFDAEAELDYLLVPWDRIVGDVLERLDEPSPPDMKELSSHARDFLIRHSRRLGRTLRSNIGTLVMLAAFAFFLVVVVASISFLVRSGMNFYDGSWGWGLFDCFLAGLWFVAGTAAALVAVFRTRRQMTFRYGEVRRDLLALFRVAAITPRELANELEKHEDKKYGDGDTISGTGYIAAGLRDDAAMQIFSLAQTCLRAADAQPDDAPLIIL